MNSLTSSSSLSGAAQASGKAAHLKCPSSSGAGGLSIANAYSVFNKTFLDTLVAQDTSWYQALTMAHSGPLAAGYAHLINAGHGLSLMFGRKKH